jgi:hypothetical protein
LSAQLSATVCISILGRKNQSKNQKIKKSKNQKNQKIKKSKNQKNTKIKKYKNVKIQKLFLCCRVWAAVSLSHTFRRK